jgi:thiol-disulfide isomerase/thioredoxin
MLVANTTTPSVNFEEFVPTGIELQDANGEKSKKIFDNKYIGIYITAGFCGPCKQFTKRLESYATKYKDNFEVVTISLDRCDESNAEYLKSFRETSFSFLPYFFKPNGSVWDLTIKLVGGRGQIPLLVIYDENRNFVGVGNDLIVGDILGEINYRPWDNKK